MFLEQIGANAQIHTEMRPYQAAGLELGRVSFAAHEQYRIFLESGEQEASPTGRLRYDEVLPAVGDWVAARPVGSGFALIEAVLPRTTQFSRRAAGTSVALQVIAANIDLALIVCALDNDFNLRRMERYLVLAADSGAQTAIVLNKADLSPDPEAQAKAVLELSTKPQIICLTALSSVEPLRSVVQGRTVALLGSSGAGKSTIANGLLSQSLQKTSSVRESDSRGRHTTTSRMLLPLPGGGAIIDNPGMRELQLWADQDSLNEVFEDIASISDQCRFRDCTHSGELGCAIPVALNAGQLDPARWTSYQKLLAELRYRETEQDPNARAARKKLWKSLHKQMRHHPKYQP